MSEITYKQATTEDLQTLFDLSVKFQEYNVASSGEYDKFFWPNWEEEFKEEISDDVANENGVVFLAYGGDEPVGYVYAKYCKECYYFLVDELFVNENYRGNNIGGELLEMAMEWGKRFNVPIRVEIFEWNKKALDFYLKQGFKIDSLVLERPEKEDPGKNK